jgi:modified peptide precursor CbpA
MATGSGGLLSTGALFYFWREQMSETTKEAVKLTENNAEKPETIALRKSCDAEGTGLSHYILMDKTPR